MIMTYCHLCNKTITVETNPIPKENINPNNGFTICNRCYNNNFSIEAVNFKNSIVIDKKISKLLRSRNSLTPNLIKELDTKLNNSIQEINTIKNNTNDEITIKYSDYLIRCINKLSSKTLQ